MNEILHSTPFILLLITSSYWIGSYIYRRSKVALLHPVLISICVVIGVLKLLHIPYETFERGGEIINFMLGPTVVALGYTLYEQVGYLKGKVISIITSVTVGSFVGITSVIGVCKLMGSEQVVISSLQPKSVTIPIAISLTEHSGGIPALTVIAVVFCGIFGGIVGPAFLRRIGVRSQTAFGLAMGSAAHGLGTARAIEIGAIEGAISGLSIGLTGVMTAILIPLVEKL